MAFYDADTNQGYIGGLNKSKLNHNANLTQNTRVAPRIRFEEPRRFGAVQRFTGTTFREALQGKGISQSNALLVKSEIR
ncbi:unnamed protein product [Clonostachys rosea]|uniref:Uncharacterized protein n=1 Tax=Bionectria ochroleuca TaxID=29856 RepID=A0ABY6TR94_BIOOC|nr:unnamed protein product [Clonostachys rosea]